MKTSRAFLLLLNLAVTSAWGVEATPGELSEAQRWAGAKFEGQPETKPAEGFLIVSLKRGSVEKNGIKGHLLRIANRDYRHGLHCPSEGEVVVYLPGPGKSFEAVVGLDSNDVGYYSNAGRGSVIASVEMRGKEVFRSPVMREGMPGVPVKVDLGGATEFTLKVSDAGQGTVFGTDFNQADWAEALAVLEDGKSLSLADLPRGPLRAPFSPDVPFSFRYGDQSSSVLLSAWGLERSSRQLDEARTGRTLTYTDPKTRLVVRCEAILYKDFPVAEWTLYFKNAGTTPTPILENIQPLDTWLERNAEGEFLLHHSKGSTASATDYEPVETLLGEKHEAHFAAVGGRPTDGDLPYFNLEWPGEGVIVALGWPGQWAAEFKRDTRTEIHLRAGQELTHFRLLPGEEVRSPLAVMLFWKGDWLTGQNLWRRWMLAHNLPRPSGKLPPPQTAAGSGRQDIEMQGANEENQKRFIASYLQAGLKIDYWWMDAGWYPFKDGWWNVGTWMPDPRRFPQGLRPIADYAHARGVKIIVWVEPERVTPGTELYEKHPEWLLGQDGETKLLDLGNSRAREWLTEKVDALIREQGIDLYRQDFNIAPLRFWRAHDADDREGITEIRYVTGLLAFWDELRRRHPSLLIDTCASGGRRNDLETLRRAVPLWRSDYAYEATGMQDHTYGIALWIPFFGTGINALDRYTFRSQMSPAAAISWDPRRQDLDLESLRGLAAEWRRVAGNFFGDYYPLSRYDAHDDVWLAWQFDRPETGEGMVLTFRRPNSPIESARYKLRGLEASARYRVTNLDDSATTELTGHELMESGLLVSLTTAPASALIVYQRVAW
jgi:alpha-galactosidase